MVHVLVHVQLSGVTECCLLVFYYIIQLYSPVLVHAFQLISTLMMFRACCVPTLLLSSWTEWEKSIIIWICVSFNFLHMYVCQIITCACMVLNSPASGTSLEKNMFRHAAKIIADWSTALAVHFVRKSNDVYLQINNHREFLYLISSNHIYTDVLLLFFWF